MIGRIFYSLGFGLFRILLSFTLVFVPVFLVFSSPNIIKKAFDKPGNYASLPEVFYNESSKQNMSDSLPLKDPRVKDIFLSSFTSSDAKYFVESITDGYYDWLTSKVDSVKYEVDLSKQNNDFANKIADYGLEKYQKLPQCYNLPKGDSLFTATCRSVYVNTDRVKQNITDSLADDSILPSKLNQDYFSNQTDMSKRYPQAPHYFSLIKLATYSLIAAVLLVGLMLVLLSKRKVYSLYKIFKSMIAAGVLVAFIPVLYKIVLPHLGFDLFKPKNSDATISTLATNLFGGLINEVFIYTLYFSVGMVIVGLVGYLIIKSGFSSFVEKDSKTLV